MGKARDLLEFSYLRAASVNVLSVAKVTACADHGDWQIHDWLGNCHWIALHLFLLCWSKVFC